MYAILVCYDEAQTRLEARTFAVVSMSFASLFVLSLLIELQSAKPQQNGYNVFGSKFSSVLKLGRVQFWLFFLIYLCYNNGSCYEIRFAAV
jgi:hypothetical protein